MCHWRQDFLPEGCFLFSLRRRPSGMFMSRALCTEPWKQISVKIFEHLSTENETNSMASWELLAKHEQWGTDSKARGQLISYVSKSVSWFLCNYNELWAHGECRGSFSRSSSKRTDQGEFDSVNHKQAAGERDMLLTQIVSLTVVDCISPKPAVCVLSISREIHMLWRAEPRCAEEAGRAWEEDVPHHQQPNWLCVSVNKPPGF